MLCLSISSDIRSEQIGTPTTSRFAVLYSWFVTIVAFCRQAYQTISWLTTRKVTPIVEVTSHPSLSPVQRYRPPYGINPRLTCGSPKDGINHSQPPSPPPSLPNLFHSELRNNSSFSSQAQPVPSATAANLASLGRIRALVSIGGSEALSSERRDSAPVEERAGPGARKSSPPETGAVFKGVRILLEQNATGGHLGSDEVMCAP